ncbi:insulinase family protein, partial [Klebsiella pneumoniae]|nr:insulinase family protein [Klebsiella pneumoniae]
LHRYYERALAEDELDLYVIGDVDEEEVLNTVRQRFLLPDRAEPARTPQAQAKARGEVKEVIERQDVKQGKLNIGYRT